MLKILHCQKYDSGMLKSRLIKKVQLPRPVFKNVWFGIVLTILDICTSTDTYSNKDSAWFTRMVTSFSHHTLWNAKQLQRIMRMADSNKGINYLPHNSIVIEHKIFIVLVTEKIFIPGISLGSAVSVDFFKHFVCVVSTTQSIRHYNGSND